MSDDDNDGQMISGELGGLKLPDICLTGEEEPRKILTQETCPDRGRTRARCVTGAHAAAWSTAVDKIRGDILTLIVPRGREIGSKQPRLKCQKNSSTHFVYFWSLKTPPIQIWNNLHKLQKQGQSLHIWTTSTSTTDCYKLNTLYNFYHYRVLADLLPAILSGETELALGTKRDKT